MTTNLGTRLLYLAVVILRFRASAGVISPREVHRITDFIDGWLLAGPNVRTSISESLVSSVVESLIADYGRDYLPLREALAMATSEDD